MTVKRIIKKDGSKIYAADMPDGFTKVIDENGNVHILSPSKHETISQLALHLGHHLGLIDDKTLRAKRKDVRLPRG
jgi:hypothetical protein